MTDIVPSTVVPWSNEWRNDCCCPLADIPVALTNVHFWDKAHITLGKTSANDPKRHWHGSSSRRPTISETPYFPPRNSDCTVAIASRTDRNDVRCLEEPIELMVAGYEFHVSVATLALCPYYPNPIYEIANRFRRQVT